MQKPQNLRCEFRKNPLGVDINKPRFSWILPIQARGQFQKAYHVIVSSKIELCEQGIGDAWDSGIIQSSQSSHIVYNGIPLVSHKRYFWRVRWWDKTDNMSDFSDITFFETGFINADEWQAKWIGKLNCTEFTSKGSEILGENLSKYIHTYCIYLRNEFKLSTSVSRATAYICGLGFYELRINGQKIGNHVLDPAQTDYHKISLYSTYDITKYLQENNAVGVLVGNGRHIKNYGYDHPKMICQIHIEFTDGTTEIIMSNDSWKVAHGPLQENGIYYGEKYDARQEMPGWDQPGFNDTEWEKAIPVPGTELRSQLLEPIRVTDILKPVNMYSPESWIYIYDFRQNFTGWAKLKVRGTKGTEVRLRYAELVNENGTLNIAPNQNAEATDVYIMNGDGIETYEPRFTVHGFRYVEVTGFPGVPTLENIAGCFVHSDVTITGTFHCSNELINKIHQNIIWGQLSNLMSIPTDCPQRDERYGWLGDVQLTTEESILNFDMAAFYTKFLRDIQLEQKEDGSLPDTVPSYLPDLMVFPTDPGWGTAYITIAWNMYWHYDDTRILDEHYSSMKKYIQFLENNSEQHIITKLGKYGDWCPPGSIGPKKTPVELTATWYYYHDVLLFSKIAQALSKEKDAEYFMQLVDEIKAAFNEKFLEDDQYAAHRVCPVDKSPNQTSQILPLYLDMVPAAKKENVLKRLLQSIINGHDYHIDTGILGTKYILDVLSHHDCDEIAYKIVTQKTYPGWGYMITEGATTLWERWEKITGNSMNSHNHIMLGSIDSWFYRVIAGITCLAPGWKKIRFKPPILDDLSYATASLKTTRGETMVAWRKLNNSFELIILIPTGAEAEVYIPMPWSNAVLKENGDIIWNDDKYLAKNDMSFLEKTEKYLVFNTASGYYRFILQATG